MFIIFNVGKDVEKGFFRELLVGYNLIRVNLERNIALSFTVLNVHSI